MEKIYTYEDLLYFAKPLIHFGELVMEIKETEGGSLQITPIDVESGQLVNSKGEVVENDYTSSTSCFTCYVNETGKIGFIEHGFSAFTNANKDRVKYLLQLLDMTFDYEDLKKHLYTYK